MLCKHCNLVHEETYKNCIVCGRILIKSDYEEKLIMPGYPNVKAEVNKTHLFLKIFGVFTLSVSIILGIINLMTFDQVPTLWSLIVIGIFLFIWSLFSQVIFSKHNYSTRTNRQVLIVAAFLVTIDYLTGHQGWAITYAIPFMLLTTTILLPLIISTMPSKYFLHVRSLFLLIIFNMAIPVVAYITPLMNDGVVWTGMMNGVAGLILFITMWLIAPRTTYDEVVKMFHI